MMRTLEDYLERNARLYPDKVAIIQGEEKVSYSTLWNWVSAWAEMLLRQGLRPGKAMVIRASQTIDYLVTYFAIHRAKGVAVPLENSIPEERFREIGESLSNAAIPVGTADILFTTGTTGKSKGVMIGHEAILANAENLIDAQGFTSSLTFIICGPLNHIGSLSKVYPVVLTGGTLRILEGLKDMNAFFSALEQPGGRFATFLVPASIRMILALDGEKLRKYADVIDFIETGAAPISQMDMERLCELLPKTRLYNTYASTETGIVCTHDFNAGYCVSGCLGKPMRHSRVRITDEGTVACSGSTVMTGYIGEPEATASILRGGVVFTHDYGRIDEEGRLHLVGRVDDVINVGGFKVAPSEIEEVAMTMPEVVDCVCVSASHPIMGSVLKLLVVPTEGTTLDKRRMARHIRSRLETYKVPLIYEEVERICRTYNGKIDRKAYR